MYAIIFNHNYAADDDGIGKLAAINHLPLCRFIMALFRLHYTVIRAGRIFIFTSLFCVARRRGP